MWTGISCGFDLHFLKVSDIEHCFCAYWPYVFLLWEMSDQVHCLFFNQILLLSYWNSLYILDINYLWGIWFPDIFFHSVGCLFTLLFVSDAQKFLIWYSLIYFSFDSAMCFWCPIQEITIKSNVAKSFFLCYFLRVL